MRPSVAIIVPVLNRPHKVVPLIRAFTIATPEPHRLLFVADPDDHAELAALRAAHADVLILDTEPRSFGAKINAGYHATDDPWIFTAADDLVPHRDWFTRALSWAKPEHGVIGTNDIANPNCMTGAHSTHSLVRRTYIERHSGVVDRTNTVMCELYGHEWVDTEFVGTAKARGMYVHAYDSIVEHQHPAWGTAPDDATYRKGQSTGLADSRIYQRRVRLWDPNVRAATRLAPPPAPTNIERQRPIRRAPNPTRR